MKIIITERQLEEIKKTTKDYIIVYRGQPLDSEDISPRDSIWVTKDYDFASEYGKVEEYKLSKNLNILNTENYSKWEELIDEFGGEGDYEEYMYQPSDDFIDFLKENGFDGFVNGDNILIFDKSNLLI